MSIFLEYTFESTNADMAKPKRPNPSRSSKGTKKQKASGPEPSVLKKIGTGIKNSIVSRAAVLKFAAIFTGLMIAFYLFYVSPFYDNHFLPVVVKTQASVANWFLNLLGFNTQVSGYIITGEGFSVSLQRGCDGLEAIAILLAGIAIIPVPFRLKVPGFLAGTAVLLVLNQLRIGGLYIAGLYWPGTFDFLHLHGGFIIFSLMAILILTVWVHWAKRKLTNAKASQND
jgi:exosortase/archaeosortase family protein